MKGFLKTFSSTKIFQRQGQPSRLWNIANKKNLFWVLPDNDTNTWLTFSGEHCFPTAYKGQQPAHEERMAAARKATTPHWRYLL